MIGVDTNVLVRYVMQDEPNQAAQASRILESLSADTPGFVTVVVIVELFWVLSSCYDLDRQQLVEALESLLQTQALIIESAAIVWKALRTYRSGSADFTDCLIASTAAAAGCYQTVTFDRRAAKFAGMTLVA